MKELNNTLVGKVAPNKTDRMWLHTQEDTSSSCLKYLRKGVWKSVNNPYSVVNQTKTTATIEPNVYNLWSTPVTSLTISLASNADTTVMPEYVFEFTAALTGWTGLTFTDAANIYLSGDFTIVGGGTYQISIVNGIAIMAKV